MNRMTKLLAAAAALTLVTATAVSAVELDPKIIGFKLPDRSNGPTIRPATAPPFCRATPRNRGPMPCCSLGFRAR
jgi:hypothetical protein